MKIKIFPFAISILVFLNLHSQTLHPPTIERYLFSATTEGADGVRLNPAITGIKHHVNFNFYVSTFNKPLSKNFDFGFLLQNNRAGLGLKSEKFGDSSMTLLSFSFGFGKRNFTSGFGIDYIKVNDEPFKTSFNIGFLSRPFEFVAFSFVLQNLTGRYFRATPFERKYIFGAGLRPTGDDRLTLSGDVFINDKGKLKNSNYKYGAEFKVIDGLKISALFDNSKIFTNEKVLLFGITINFQNAGVRFFSNGDKINSKFTISTFYSSEYLPTSFYPVKRIAEVEIKGEIPDYKEQPSIFSKPRRSVHDIVSEIERSAKDKDISGLILKIYPFSGEIKIYELEAITQEIVDAVKKVKKAGKPVVAYLGGENAGVNELYLASVADKIVIAPECMIVGYGAIINVERLKSFFEKFGIEWDAMTAGKFKSTFHSYYTDSATTEQAQLIKSLAEDIHRQLIEQISKTRGIQFTEDLINEISSIVTPSRAKELGIVDEIGFYDEAKKMANKLANKRDNEKVNLVKVGARKYWETAWGEIPKIAVIGVHGSILTGESQPPIPFPFLSERVTGSETVVKQINQAVGDKSVKAIILRVNSPGGSALASNEIYTALKESRKKKPVIVSFGNIAASGGYYVSCSSEKIFASPATLTGSIGVVFAKPVISKLYDNLKIKVEQYKEGEHSDMFSPLRHLTDVEKRKVEEMLQYTYLSFKQKVAENRNMTLDEVENLAQGKVYTGTQALKLKLVDELGGLSQAIGYLEEKLKLKKYEVKFYTVPSLFGFEPGIVEQLINSLFIKNE
jgi:protease-4